MEHESNQMQAPQPTLCRSGCGFYGSPATDNLCSLCYKEALKKKQQPPSDRPSPVSQQQQQASSVVTLPSSPAQVLASASSFAPSIVSSVTSSSGAASMDTAQPTVPSLSLAGGSSSELQHCKEMSNDLDGVSMAMASASSSVTSGDTEESDPLDTSAGGKQGDDESSSSDKDSSASKKKKNRCATCRKKVGLTGFECRCGGLYCSLHRYSDMHECSFDYREMGAQEIRRNNPVVVGEKIQKI